jgi:glycine cleavage system H protein
MAEVREDLRYTEAHEWLKIQNNIAIIGITDHAQAELTDIVFVELPEIGKEFNYQRLVKNLKKGKNSVL